MIDGCRGTWSLGGRSPTACGGDPADIGWGDGYGALWGCQQFGYCATPSYYNAGFCCTTGDACDYTDPDPGNWTGDCQEDGGWPPECPQDCWLYFTHPTFCSDGYADYYFYGYNYAPYGYYYAQPGAVYAATDKYMQWTPVLADSPPGDWIISDNEIILVQGGAHVWMEIRIGDVEPLNSPNVTEIRAWDVVLDSSGYYAGLQGTMAPWWPECWTDFNCEVLLKAPVDCVPAGPVFPPGVCPAGWIDQTRTDYIFFGQPTDMVSIDLSMIDFRYGSGVLDPIIAPDFETYAGTLFLELSADAYGSFYVGFNPLASRVADGSGVPIPMMGFVPGLITIAPHCCLPGGSCVAESVEYCEANDGVAVPQCLGDNNNNGKDDACEPCCLPDASCVPTTAGNCQSQGGSPVTACLADNNNNGMDDACEPLQACCLVDGSCQDLNHTDCVGAGGDPQGLNTSCLTRAYCRDLKWAQPPTHSPLSPNPECFWGWDEGSVYDLGPVVADDYLCQDPLPITDVHWWGSYFDWSDPDPPSWAPGSFHIGIWTDVPAGVDQPFSHPGTMLRQWVVDRGDLNERRVGCDFHPDFTSVPETCFRYDFIIPQEQWFYQPGPGDPTVYWVSIAAVYEGDPGDNPWGWKTREHHFGDDAVRILSPTAPEPGFVFEQGEPITDLAGASWDMAFVLTTKEPRVAYPPETPSGEAGYEKVRYISMAPGNPWRPTALRVTLADLPPPFSELNGTRYWVGEPREVTERAGRINPTPGWPDFVLAKLQGAPHCMDWSTVEVVHVSDDHIVPGAVYAVQAVDCDCDLGDEWNYSEPLAIATSGWGDLVGTCAVLPCSPPNGVVGIPTDASACLDKFKNLANAVIKSRADIEPSHPDQLINIRDITFVVDAFRGFAYPFEPDPAP